MSEQNTPSHETVPQGPMHGNLAVIAKAIGLVVAGAVLAIAIASVSGLPGKKKAKFAVVDLAAVVRTNQQAAVALLSSGTADQRTRDAALASAQGFGKRLDAEVVALSKECGCVLLMREAVVAGEVEDLTPTLLSRLTKH